MRSANLCGTASIQSPNPTGASITAAGCIAHAWSANADLGIIGMHRTHFRGKFPHAESLPHRRVQDGLVRPKLNAARAFF